MNDPFLEALHQGLGDVGPDIPEDALFEYPLKDTKLIDELFVTRKNEMKDLGSAVSGAIRGLYKQIFVKGGKGMGKTTTGTYLLSIQKKGNFIVIAFGKNAYNVPPEELLLSIISILLQRSIDASKMTEDRDKEDPKQTRLRDTLGRIFNESFGLKTFLKEVLEQEEQKSKLSVEQLKATLKRELTDFVGENEDELNFLAKKTNKKIFLLFDDCHILLREKQPHRDFIRELCKPNRLNATAIYLLYPEIFDELVRTNDELAKDAAVITLGPLTPLQCKELLWRRLQKYRSLSIKKTPDYASELQPFTESGTEYATTLANGSPLAFIHLLRKAVEKAKFIGKKIIDEEIIDSVSSPTLKQIPLPNEKARKILEKITEKPGITRQELVDSLGYDSIVVHLYLKKLVDSKIAVRKRDVRKYRYYRSEEVRTENVGLGESG